MRTQSRDNEKLKKELDTINAEIVTLQSENDLLKQRVQALEMEHVVLKCQYDALVAANDAFLKSESVSQAQLQIEIESLKADRLLLEMKNNTLVLEKKNLLTENQEMLKEINLVNARLANLLTAKVQVFEKENSENLLTKVKLRSAFCPVTHDVMTDPVIADDGLTYSKVGIDNWISVKKRIGETLTSPLTGANMKPNYIPNYALKDLLEELRRAIAEAVTGSLHVGDKIPCP
jgi:hypothetical protein